MRGRYKGAGACVAQLVIGLVLMEKFYAVKIGRVPGIYTTWEECEAQVKRFRNAKFKRFKTMVEAQNFIDAEMHTW